MKAAILLFFLLVTLAPDRLAAANECPPVGEWVEFRDGGGTGSDLRKMDDRSLSIYISGYISALYVAPVVLPAFEPCVDLIHQKCFAGRHFDQLTAILRKYLADHPDEWHNPANIIVFKALIGPCLR